MQPDIYRKKITVFTAMAILFIAMACLFSWVSGVEAAMDSIWLGTMSRTGHTGKSHGHGAANHSGGGHSHGGQESEMRPMPIRTYWLDTCQISDGAEAYVTRPEGDAEKLPIEREGHDVKVSVRIPMGDGPGHGANTVYLIDRSVEENVLKIKTAKWLTIQHSCGWGHDQKFNPARQVMHPFKAAPLEIVADKLWDGNFHSRVMSGDMISFQVLSYGKPAPGVSVTVISDRGWRKTINTDKDGRGSFQLVRDYYPEAWQFFDRTKRGRLRISASYSTNDAGQYEGQSYEKTRMSSTFAWRYYPARKDYVSMVYGLAVVFFSVVFGGFGVFIYRERRKRPYREIDFDEKSR